MSLSLGIGLGVAMQRGVSGGFSPSALFASGEEGVLVAGAAYFVAGKLFDA